MGESVRAEDRSSAERPPYRDHTAWDHRRDDEADAWAAIRRASLRSAGTIAPGSVGGAGTVPSTGVTSDVRTIHHWWWHYGMHETAEMVCPHCEHPDPTGGPA